MEVEDLTRCDVVTFDDKSTLIWNQDGVQSTISMVVLDTWALRPIAGWRLAGTKPLSSVVSQDFPGEEWLISAEDAAQRLGMKVEDLLKIPLSDLFPWKEGNPPSYWFFENQVDYYHRLHPNS